MARILEHLKSIIAEQIVCDPGEVELLNSLHELGFDSLDKTELILTCEEAFAIEISDEDESGIITVAGLYDAILRASGVTL